MTTRLYEWRPRWLSDRFSRARFRSATCCLFYGLLDVVSPSLSLQTDTDGECGPRQTMNVLHVTWLRQLSQLVVISRFDYGNAALAGLPHLSTAPLQRFLNSAACLVFGHTTVSLKRWSTWTGCRSQDVWSLNCSSWCTSRSMVSHRRTRTSLTCYNR